VELDSQDFQTAVIVAEAQLARAISAYAQEETRAKQARLNWEDLGYDEEPTELVLRLPQLREAKANVDSATAQLEQAKRNLERTKVRAPFDGRVRQRRVGLGQSVGPGTPLGSIFAIEFAEVRLPIAARDMAFLRLPEGPEDSPIDVQLRDALNHDGTTWTAKIIRTEGTLDENSLDLFAIARVLDPFGRKSDRPPLRIGQPVVASIPGRVLKDVIVVPRMAVRQLDRIILVDPNELTIKSHRIETIWSDEEHVVVRDPMIADGSLLATTHLIYAPNGSKVEILPDPNVATKDMAGFESKDKAGGNEQLQEGQ
jgi:RND family efflux transporter MFP subunit